MKQFLFGIAIALLLGGAAWVGENGYGQVVAKILLLLVAVSLVFFGIVIIIAALQNRSRIMRNR